MKNQLKANYVEIVNESHKHSKGKETHFNMLVVSGLFKDLNRVKRQQLVYSLMKDEFDDGLHALNLRCVDQNEFEDDGRMSCAKSCMGYRE